MGFIYKITNQINEKMYIGKTEYENPYKRWNEHKNDYNTKRCEKRPLYDAMNKYGIDNFVFEIIQQEDNPDKLCELEKMFIEKYRTYVGFKDCNGYNATLGGDGKCYLKLNENDVIKIHIQNDYIVGNTARHFNVDRGTIVKILLKHNIKWLSCEEIIEMNYLQKYGGLVQFDGDMTHVICIYDSPKYVLYKNENYKEGTLRSATSLRHQTHRAYGYIWYRLSELPEKYKPLIDDYYKS